MKDYKIVLTPNDIRRIEIYLETDPDIIDDILKKICHQAERKAKEIISK